MKNMKKSLQIIVVILVCTLVTLIGVQKTKAVDYDICVTDEEYGADGTDMVSDYSAIQKALNSVRDSETMVTVYIPAGTYYLDRGLTLFSNTHLVLDEKAVMIRMDMSAFMLQSYRDNETGGYGQFHDIIIEGGTWDGNVNEDTASGQGTPMMFYHGKNITIKNTDIKNYCSRHLVIIAGVDGITVDNVSFSDQHMYSGEDAMGSYMIYEKDGTLNVEGNFRAMEALHLDCINEDGSTEIPGLPYDNTNNKNISVTNCAFKHVYTGVGTHCEYNPIKAENMTITGNTFDNVSYTCVDVFNTDKAVVKDNTAKNVGEFIRSNNSSDVVISNNSANIIYASEYNMYAAYLIDTTATITDCDFVNASNNGLYLVNSKLDKFENFSISGARENGIAAINGSEILEAKNITIKNSGICGIYGKDSGAIVISESDISGSKDCGIATENCKAVSITDCNITDSTSHAISIIGTSSAKYNGNITGNTISKANIGISTHGVTIDAIDNNKITDTKGIGLAIHSDVKSGSISGNTITGTGDIGVLVSTKSDIAKINNNVVVSTVKDGIYIKDNSTVGEISGNVLNDIGQYGLFVNASTAKLTNNIVKTTQRHGINISNGSNVEITDNQVSNTGQYGIYVSDSKGVIVRNLVDTTVKTGIGVSSATSTSKDNIDIKENTVLSAGDQGIYVYKSDYINVGDNSVSDSTTQGIKITGSNYVVVNDNETTDNQKQGIMADSSNNCVLDGNVILGSGDYGIYITSCKSIDVADNVSANNAKVDIVANNSTTGNVTNNAVGEGGIGNWNGSPVNISGTTKYIGLATFGSIADQKYTGSALKPGVTVKYNGATLKAGTDYTLTYKDNVKVGVATVIITGKGNYGGVCEKTFKIVQPPSTNVLGFEDMDPGKWYYSYIAEAYKLGLMTGLNDKEFGPSRNLSRSMAVTVMSRLDNILGIDNSKLPMITETGFSDVTNHKDWFFDYVIWAKRTGVVTGYSDGTFRPKKDITRQEFAIMMMRYVEHCGKSVAVKDNDPEFTKQKGYSDISSWAVKEVKWAYQNGIIGVGSSKGLDPTGVLTRAEAATIILRVYDLIKK